MRQPAPPMLNTIGLPAEEQERAEHIGHLLYELDSHISEFRAALQLFEHGWRLDGEHKRAIKALGEIYGDPIDRALLFQQRDSLFAARHVYQAWTRISARDAAMTIYHFGHIVDGIVKGVRKCPSLFKLVDEASLRAAQPLFEKYFKKSTRMRNAVGHVGESNKTMEKMKEHSFHGRIATQENNTIGGPTKMDSVLTRDRLAMTFMGDMVSVEMKSETLNNLIEIRDAIYSAFQASVMGLRKLSLEKLQSTGAIPP